MYKILINRSPAGYFADVLCAGRKIHSVGYFDSPAIAERAGQDWVSNTLPGMPADIAGAIRNRASAPLRAGKAQLPCDVGLFGDATTQMDLVDMLERKP